MQKAVQKQPIYRYYNKAGKSISLYTLLKAKKIYLSKSNQNACIINQYTNRTSEQLDGNVDNKNYSLNKSQIRQSKQAPGLNIRKSLSPYKLAQSHINNCHKLDKSNTLYPTSSILNKIKRTKSKKSNISIICNNIIDKQYKQKLQNKARNCTSQYHQSKASTLNSIEQKSSKYIFPRSIKTLKSVRTIYQSSRKVTNHRQKIKLLFNAHPKNMRSTAEQSQDKLQTIEYIHEEEQSEPELENINIRKIKSVNQPTSTLPSQLELYSKTTKNKLPKNNQNNCIKTKQNRLLQCKIIKCSKIPFPICRIDTIYNTINNSRSRSRNMNDNTGNQEQSNQIKIDGLQSIELSQIRINNTDTPSSQFMIQF